MKISIFEVSREHVSVTVADHSAKQIRIEQYVTTRLSALQKEQREEPAKAESGKKAFEPKSYEAGLYSGIKAILSKAKIPGSKVHVIIDSNEAVIRPIQLPYTNREQIDRTFAFQLESAVPGLDIAECVSDHFINAQTPKSTDLVACAVKSEVMRSILNAFQQAGLVVQTVNVDIICLYNTVRWMASFESANADKDKPFLAVFYRESSFKSILLEKQMAKSFRSCHLPAPKMTATQIEEYSRNREWKTEEVHGPIPVLVVEDETASKLSNVDDDAYSSSLVVRELLKTAVSAGLTPLHYLLICGSVFERGLSDLVLTRMKLEPRFIDYGSNVSATEDIKSRIAVAVGGILHIGNSETPGVNLRKGEFELKHRRHPLVSSALILMQAGILFLTFTCIREYFVGIKKANKDLQTIQGMKLEVYKGVVDSKEEDPLGVYEKMKEIYFSRPGQSEEGEKSALEGLSKLGKAMMTYQMKYGSTGDADTSYVEILDYKINGKSATASVKFKVKVLDARDRLTECLRSVFIDVRPGGLGADNTFVVDCKYAEK